MPHTLLSQIKSALKPHITLSQSEAKRFFKTDKASYAAHDKFLGITVPNLRKIAKQFADTTLPDVKKLLTSPFNEERMLALIILVNQYQKGGKALKEKIATFYLKNKCHINNWNLVDASAHHILGAYLWERDRDILNTLAKSKNLWDRRIAIVATWYFIRNNDLEWTFKIATLLMYDKEDLIHKAVGWMLREAGKKDSKALVLFLDKYATKMPRTMLRYVIERLDKKMKDMFLKNHRPHKSKKSPISTIR